MSGPIDQVNPRIPIPNDLVADWCGLLLCDIEELTAAIVDRVLGDAANSGAPPPIPQDILRATARAGLAEFLCHLAVSGEMDLSLARTIGRLGAAHGIPLDTARRAFRAGAKLVWERLIRALADDAEASALLLAATTDMWSALDHCARALVSAFSGQGAGGTGTAQSRAAHEALLAGRAATEADAWVHANVLGLPRLGSFAVVVASPQSAGGQQIARLRTGLGEAGARSSWLPGWDGLTGIVALPDGFGMDRLCDALGARLGGAAGVSAVYDRLTATPLAFQQAQMACIAVGSGDRTVVRYDRPSAAVLLAAAPDVAAAMQHSVLGRILALADADRDSLLWTLQCWFETGGDLPAAAERLYCHRNTVRYRLNRIAELTDRDLFTPIDAGQVFLALEAHRLAQSQDARAR